MNSLCQSPGPSSAPWVSPGPVWGMSYEAVPGEEVGTHGIIMDEFLQRFPAWVCPAVTWKLFCRPDAAEEP